MKEDLVLAVLCRFGPKHLRLGDFGQRNETVGRLNGCDLLSGVKLECWEIFAYTWSCLWNNSGGAVVRRRLNVRRKDFSTCGRISRSYFRSKVENTRYVYM